MPDAAAAPSLSKRDGFGPIQTVDEARKAARDARHAFWAMAAIQAVVALIVQQFVLLPDAVAYLLLGYLVSRTMSRAVAILLALVALLSFTLAMLMKAGMYQGCGGSSIIVGGIAAYYGLRAVHGTIRYHQLVQTRINRRSLAALTALTIALHLVVFVAALFLCAWLGYDFSDTARDAVIGPVLIAVVGVITLLVYGASYDETFHRAARYVHRVLRGSKPASCRSNCLRIGWSPKLTTAKALGVTIPPSLLARADQVIE